MHPTIAAALSATIAKLIDLGVGENEEEALEVTRNLFAKLSPEAVAVLVQLGEDLGEYRAMQADCAAGEPNDCGVGPDDWDDTYPADDIY
jgi:hypothetical protein